MEHATAYFAFVALAGILAGWTLLRALGLSRASRERRRLGGLRLRDLDRLDGAAFESWVAERLRRSGIPCVATPRAKDYGVDLIATLGWVRVGIEVKRRARPVSNRAIRSVHSGCSFHRCALGAVVTQAAFSGEARRQAQAAEPPILLLGRDELPDLARHLWDAAGGAA